MSYFRAHPVGEGNHQNVHILAVNKKNKLKFNIVVFLESNLAYIVRHKNNPIANTLDSKFIHDRLTSALSKWDYKLATPEAEVFKNHFDTNAVIKHFNL